MLIKDAKSRNRLLLPGLLVVLLASGLFLTRQTRGQDATLRIFFLNVGQGHSALIVSPTGRTMLIDGGPDGTGAAQAVPLMRSLGLTKLDVMIASHYHTDHVGGLDEIARAFPPEVAYDRGDLIPPSTLAYRQYVQAVGAARRTIAPGTSIDLGGGALATCVVVAGKLISGGEVPILGRSDQFDQLENSASIGMLIQFGDFDAVISGDLTGGGINTTDVESVLAQVVSDVDIVQLNHHASRTSSNPAYLGSLKAEVGIAQIGTSNSFLHPSLVVTDRFINLAPTSGLAPTAPNFNVAVERVPYFVQNQPSPNSGSVSQQGLVANGHIEIDTDGLSYTVKGGFLIPINMVCDGAGKGVDRDFPPTVVLRANPLIPAAGQPLDLDIQASDDSAIPPRIEANVQVDGGEPSSAEAQSLSGKNYRVIVPGQVDGSRVTVSIKATDQNGRTSSARLGYFAGVTPIARLRMNDRFGEPLFSGYPARISGIVTVGSGSLSTTSNDIYVQDDTGGIHVQEFDSRSRTVAAGDRVLALGQIGQYAGETILDSTNPYTSYPFEPGFGIIPEAAGTVPSPVLRGIGMIGEPAEGLLIRIDNVRVTSGTIRPTGSSNLRISDGTGSLTVRIESATGIPGMITPNQLFSLIGVIQQFDSFRPFTSGYEVVPRNRSDLLTANAP